MLDIQKGKRKSKTHRMLREAALCLFLLMEEDHSAVEAVVAAGGAHALTSVLNRPLSAGAAPSTNQHARADVCVYTVTVDTV